MKKALTFCVAVAATTCAFAQQSVSKRVVELARQTLAERIGAKASAASSKMDIKETVGNMSIVSAQGAGTVFVCRQNTSLKVVGYTDTPYEVGMELPDGLKMWMDATSQGMTTYVDDVPSLYSVEPQDVEYFVTTKWNQDKPYFNKCPYINLKRPMTGCVATAMAQICNYFEYPAKGHGKCTYYLNKVVAGQASVDEKTATLGDTYDWANMLDSYGGKYTDAEANAVATIMRDCGYVSGMVYGREASGSNLWTAARGLADNLDYDSLSVQICLRDYCTDAEWRDMIYTELMAKRPILFAADTPMGGSGHAFVFDGLQADGFVHINWGWGGSMNGYYDIDVMHKNAEYTAGQQMVFGFNPQPTPEGSEMRYSPTNMVMSDETILHADDKDLYFSGAFFNYDWRYFCGDVALVINNMTRQEADTLYFMAAEWVDEDDGTVEKDIMPSMYGYAFGSKYNREPLGLNQYYCPDENPVFAEGRYEAYFIVRGDCESGFRHMRMSGATVWKPIFTVAANGQITVDDPNAMLAPRPAARRSGFIYNVAGQHVDGYAKGITIQDGKKRINR